MTESNTAEVVWDAVAVVDKGLWALLFRTKHERTHVEAFERELNKCLNFLATKAVFASRRFEALETDDEDARHTVDL